MRPDTNVQRIRTLIHREHHSTVRLLATKLNMNRKTVRHIFIKDFRIKKHYATMVPKNFLEEQKLHRMSVAEDYLQQVENDPTLLDRVIMDNESSLFQYDPETKRQSQQWLTPNGPRPKKACTSKFKMKSMLICFFDNCQLVHRQFVPPGQTINQTYYCEVLDRLCKGSTECFPTSCKLGFSTITTYPFTPCSV